MLDKAGTFHAHDDDLELYLRGRLEPEYVSVLVPHLAECQTCREKLLSCIGPRDHMTADSAVHAAAAGARQQKRKS